MALPGGILWAATDKGAVRIQPRQTGAGLLQVPLPEWLNEPVALDIASSRQGVWILTRRGLALVRE